MEERIRQARPEDAGAIAAIYAPFVRESHISFETEPPTESEIATRIQTTLIDAPWLVHETDGEVDGYAYASRFRDRSAYRWSAETSVYLREDRRRRGIGRRLLATLLEALVEDGYRNAFAVIALPNAPSVALFEALGFTPAGVWREVGWKLGAWWDVGVWQKPLRHDPAPSSPRGQSSPFRAPASPDSAFRQATPADVGTLLDLMRELYAYEGFHFDEGKARAALGQVLGDESLGRVWLIEVDGQTAGYLVLGASFSLEFHGRDAYVDELYVRPPFRSRGLGSRALEHVVAQCRALGINAVHLEVGHDNPGAHALYRRLGFVDHDRHLMTKWLVDE
jgi:L-amino acid N-acyltransferase YncA